jgi:hypothetical protein
MLKELIKEILKEELSPKTESPKQVRQNPFIGKVCMIRTYSAGVHFGELVSHSGKEVVLKDAQRVHYWDGACSLSQLATEGSKKREDCRISVAVSEIVLTEAIEIIPMSEEASENLKNGTIWKS